ncbi:MAG: class I SAM-dependent methyltransferase [Planctomycetota bacterium]|nr:MAG: class I SAM-dependent methyltransferase [Planctomycetota bacterium]
MTARQRCTAAAWGAAILAVLGACAAAESPAPAPAPAAAPAAAPLLDEASVRPGINDPYQGEVQVEEWMERFEGEDRELYARRLDILEALRLRPGMVVADVGAGTGLFTLLMAGRVGEQGRVYAVDIVPEFLALIGERAQAAGLRNVVPVPGTERSIELAPGCADLAFLCDTYHHFEYPRSMLDSIRMALRPGGELVVVDFKRIPNVSGEWVMDHVRAGEEVVTQEIRSAGFVLVERVDLLDSNYFLRFRKDG